MTAMERITALEARIAQLEARLAQLEQRTLLPAVAPPPTIAPTWPYGLPIITCGGQHSIA